MERKMIAAIFALTVITPLTIAQDTPCQSGWRRKLRKFRRATRQRWPKKNTTCYDFTIGRACYCPRGTEGPFRVSVRNGVVVSPIIDDPFIPPVPTMQQIFHEVESSCFQNCPESGPAKCDVRYAYSGYVKYFAYDGSEMIADDELTYTISNFTFCTN